MKASKRGRAAALTVLLVATVALLPAGSAAAAPPPVLSQFCEVGGGAAQCTSLASIATDPNNGNVYVSDRENIRIDEFTPWGQFVKAFGGGVVNGGATGTGTLNPGSTTVSAVTTTTKAFVPGMAIEASGIKPGTTIAAIGDHTITLSQPATAAASGAPTALSSPEATGNVPTNELQRIVLTATGGSFQLGFQSRQPDSETPLTSASLPYNASAAEVQSALENLANIGPGNVAVSSTNPGGQAGVPGGPYEVEFKGTRFADTDVRGLTVSNGTPPLTGGGGKVEPVRQGASAPEVCTGLDCRRGVDGERAGQFAVPAGITVDSSGDLYVYESPEYVDAPGTFLETAHGTNRVQKFDSDGNFLLMFGGSVNEGGGSPSNPGNVCSAQDIANGDICGGGKQGSGDGEFGVAPEFKLGPSGGFIAAGPGDTIYVGGDERVQEFAADGSFLKSIPVPGEVVQALAVDSAGNIYLSGQDEADVVKLSPAGATLATLAVKAPNALATDSAGNLYVVDGRGKTETTEVELRKFSPAGAEVPGFAFHDGFKSSIGIATSEACGIAGVDLFVADSGAPFVRDYGSPPDPAICPPPAVAPTISVQYASAVSAGEATLKAQINPHFWPDATYYLQYGTGKCSEGGCDKEQPLPPGSKLTTATVNAAITVGVNLAGLTPATTYHYRFIATSSGGGPVRGLGGEVGQDGAEGTFTTFPTPAPPSNLCPNAAFRTAASANLPGCRAYELVSPVDKNGGDVTSPAFLGFNPLPESSADGEKATYSALSAFADPLGAPILKQYLSVRGPSGWSTRSITPPRLGTPLFPPGQSVQFKGFSEDLCSGWVLQDSDLALAEGAPSGVSNLYRRESCGAGASYELLSSVAPPGFGPGENDPEFYLPIPQGHSADDTHTVIRADAKLTSNACATPAIFQLYVSSKEGPLRLVSALPSGKAVCTHATAGTMEGLTDGFREASVAGAISADGSRVFWTDSEESKPVTENAFSGRGPGKLYVRLNATLPPAKAGSGCSEAEKACTLSVSGESKAQFWGADRDGTKAIYTLGKELREFDVESASSQPIANGVEGVVGAGEDLARIYFTSNLALAGSGENSEGAKAQPAKPNLYLDEGGSFTFIATLEGREGGPRELQHRPASPNDVEPFNRTSRVSPDGQHLAFASAGQISGYDNVDATSGVADAEVYVFDAEANAGAGELACVSCNPSGARPHGREVPVTGQVSTPYWAAATLPGWPEQGRPSRLLATDGSHLFFQSYDALVLRDTNGRQDVYEWQRASDNAQCQALGAELYVPSAGGCLSLISSGQSGEDSEIVDASTSGADVFFTTAESLLPQDPDLIDVYDARIDGGYPPEPGPTPACEGEACQGPVAAPNDPTPSSSTFRGAGNVKEAGKKPCPKGKVRRKGHCVPKHKKKAAKKKQAAKHSKGKAR
jgi:hypothetical protein